MATFNKQIDTGGKIRTAGLKSLGNKDNTTDSEKGHYVQINVLYTSPQNTGTLKEFNPKFSSTFDEYMEWKYFLNSPTLFDRCSKHICELDRVSIILTKDATLQIKAPCEPNKVKEIAKHVFEFVVNTLGKTLIVDKVEGLPKDRIESFTRRINDSELGKQSLIYAETIQNMPAVVYEQRYKQTVQQIRSAYIHQPTSNASLRCQSQKSLDDATKIQMKDLSEIVLCPYTINVNTCEFLESSRQFSKRLGELNGHMFAGIGNNRKLLYIKCEEKKNAAIKEMIACAETKLISFESPKVKQFAFSDEGKQCMADIVLKNDVLLIERFESSTFKELDVYEEIILRPNRSTSNRMCWTGKNKKKLVLARNNAEGIIRSYWLDIPVHWIRLSPYKLCIASKGITKSGQYTDVNVPRWIDGKSGEESQFRAQLATIISMAKQDQDECLAVCIDPVENWNNETFIRQIFKESAEWMMSTDSSGKLKTIITYSMIDENYNYATSKTDQLFNKHLQDITRGHIKPVIKVVAGELNKVKADVLVNTASAKLDLKQGMVSKVLLATAGDDLQKECAEKYPEGISKRQVAETNGHKLVCKRVYHITLEKYTTKDSRDKEQIEDIQVSMKQCIEMASKAGFKTIAFPALGTGNLQYPVELVASSMFRSVDIFKRSHKETSLEHVYFVIYPNDTAVLEHFCRTEAQLSQQDESAIKSTGDVVRFEIVGFSKDVENAKLQLKDACDDAHFGNHIIDRKLENLTEAQFSILLAFDDAKEAIKMLESIQHNAEEKAVILRGKYLEMKRILPKLEKHAQYILKMSHTEIGLKKNYSESTLNDCLMSVNTRHSDVKCVLNQSRTVMYIYGKREKFDQTKIEVLQLLKSNHSAETQYAGAAHQYVARQEKTEDEASGKVKPDMDHGTSSAAVANLQDVFDRTLPSDKSGVRPDTIERSESLSGMINKDSVPQYDGKILKGHPQKDSVNTKAETSLRTHTDPSEKKKAENVLYNCVICMDQVIDERTLKCGHVFCSECIEGYFRVKMVCPTCGKVCGIIYGDQPDGTMDVFKSGNSLAGYDGCQTIGITYQFKSGKQGQGHPRPGTPYTGIQRTAYLPDNQEGREICVMLTVAFERRLVFTIGTSRTTGKEGVITWNDIHHKTDPRPNTQFGYPDATYLQRVREELEVKGVTKEDISDSFLKELQKGSYRKMFVSKSQ